MVYILFIIITIMYNYIFQNLFQQKISELSTLTPDKPVPSVDTEALKSSINSVQANFTLINQTLSSKLQWAVEDQSRDHVCIFTSDKNNL